MSTLGFFALVKDSPESQVKYMHLRHISGMIVELPENMRQLTWSIEEHVSFQLGVLIETTWVIAYKCVPLPSSLRLTEIAVTMHDYIRPPQTPQTSTAGNSIPTSQAAPSNPVTPAVEGAYICRSQGGHVAGGGLPVRLIYSGHGCTQCLLRFSRCNYFG